MFTKEQSVTRHYEPASDFDAKMDLLTSLRREIYISHITPQIAEKVHKTILTWNAIDIDTVTETSKRKPIKLFINSNGGDYNAMVMIMGAIMASTTPVETINTGVCADEGFYIYITGHKRLAYTSATFKYTRDLFKGRDAVNDDAKITAFYDKQLDELKRILLEKTKFTEQDYQKYSRNSLYLTADEAHKFRICNEVYSSFYQHFK